MLRSRWAVTPLPGKDPAEAAMAGKNRIGRENRKPKQDKNKRHKGQTPTARSTALDAINHPNPPVKH